MLQTTSHHVVEPGTGRSSFSGEGGLCEPGTTVTGWPIAAFACSLKPKMTGTIKGPHVLRAHTGNREGFWNVLGSHF